MSSPVPSPLVPGAFGWTMAAYHATAVRTGLTAVNALTDQSLNILSNQFQVPIAYSNLAAAYAVGAGVKNACLTAPCLRKYGNYYIQPFDTAAVPASPTGFEYMGFYNPIRLTTGDLLNADVDTAGNSEYDTVLVFLSNGARMPVKGEMFTVKCSGTTTAAAHVWTLGQITADTTLEEGMYAIVGMAAESAHLIAARLVFPGVANATRPGCFGFATGAAVGPACFRYGRLGVWGVFDNANFPQIEYLPTTQDTAENVWLDLVKLTIGGTSGQAAYPALGPQASPGVSSTPVSLY